MIYIGSNFDRELDAQKHLIDVHSRSENDIREQIVALETALSSYADKHGRQVKLIQAKAQEQMDKNEEKHQQQMVAAQSHIFELESRIISLGQHDRSGVGIKDVEAVPPLSSSSSHLIHTGSKTLEVERKLRLTELKNDELERSVSFPSFIHLYTHLYTFYLYASILLATLFI